MDIPEDTFEDPEDKKEDQPDEKQEEKDEILTDNFSEDFIKPFLESKGILFLLSSYLKIPVQSILVQIPSLYKELPKHCVIVNEPLISHESKLEVYRS